MSEIWHHGILGMKWGVRRFQNKDGSLTAAGRKRYSADLNVDSKKLKSDIEKLEKHVDEMISAYSKTEQWDENNKPHNKDHMIDMLTDRHPDLAKARHELAVKTRQLSLSKVNDEMISEAKWKPSKYEGEDFDALRMLENSKLNHTGKKSVELFAESSQKTHELLTKTLQARYRMYKAMSLRNDEAVDRMNVAWAKSAQDAAKSLMADFGFDDSRYSKAQLRQILKDLTDDILNYS